MTASPALLRRRMSWTVPSRTTAAAGLGAALVPPAVVVLLVAGPRSYDLPYAATAVLVLVLSPAVVLGLVLAVRRPETPVGALLVAVGMVPLGVQALGAWGATGRGAGAWPGAVPLDAAMTGAWAWFYAPPVALALLFPDGRLPSRRWRPVLVAVVVVPLLVQAGVAVAPGTYRAGGGAVPGRTPVGLPRALEIGLGVVSLGGLAALLVAGAVAMARRHRLGTAVVRRQVRWLALSSLLVPATLLLCWASYLFLRGPDLVVIGLFAVFLAMPLAVAVAVLRHDLYDVDRLFSRTVGWLTVSAVLVTLFSTVVLGAGLLVGRGSAPAAAAAALVCAVAFNPVRRRVQAGVDRRFDRAGHLALTAVARFVDDVRDGRAEPEQVGDVLRHTLGDPSLRLLYRLPDDRLPDDRLPEGAGRAELVDARGGPATVPPGAATVEVAPAGHVLAVLVCGPTAAERPALLRDVLREAHLPVEVSRLRVQLRRSLAEVAASRARIVVAGDAERRRLERDLHDGAQQRLVALGMALRRAERADPGGVHAPLLGEAVGQLQAAVGELRRIAQGLRPGGLDGGLPPALRALVQRCPLPVDLAVVAEDVPDSVATTAYFVAAEAVTNALKHAGARRLAIDVDRTGDALRVRVSDDGRGGAVAGSGLAGLADRVAAGGGRLRLDSPAGAGTVLEAVLPCGS